MKQDSKELQKYFSAVEQTADSVFITDRNGVIEYVNPAFEIMTGFKKEEALGHTPRIVKSGYQNLKYYKKLWSTILSGRTSRTTVVNKTKDGKLFYADHTITPIRDSSGKVAHFVGIWKDITKNVAFEKKRDEFLAVASHELKNPVTTLKGYLEFLHARIEKTKDKKSIYYLNQTDSQVEKIINLINDFFDVGKIDAGKMVLNKAKFDLVNLITKIANDFKYSCKTHKITVRGSVEKPVCADPERIGQVLINLLTNAVKYSPDKTEIVITVKADKGKVCTSVKDFGPGIPKPEQKKIFGRFYQLDERRGRGFGLGLYICADIIKRHKGKIWVESEKGKGSTFYFTLPI